MIEELNFKAICDLTTNVMGLPEGSLALKSRKRTLQAARSIAGYIARTEEDINRKVIAGTAESLFEKIDMVLTGYLEEQREYEKMDMMEDGM